MPPFSRGLVAAVSRCSTSPWMVQCRCASMVKPKAPTNFLRRAQLKEPRIQQPKRKAGESESEQTASTIKRPALHSNLLKILPRFLRDRPHLRKTILSFIVALPIGGFVLFHFPIEIVQVTGPSMSPTINADCTSDRDTNYSPTWVLVQKWDPGSLRGFMAELQQGAKAISSKYGRGQMVIYSTPHNPERWALKRIVGLPGDKVSPMAGYPGGDEAVVVPYNHVWVEGDANDRNKSVDSNYFGPLCQALIMGTVIAAWTPWWKIYGLRSGKSMQQDWPARRDQRVEEDAVHSASTDPNQLASYGQIEGEAGQETLRMLKESSEFVEDKFHENAEFRKEMQQTWLHAMAAGRHHPDERARGQAKEIAAAMERVLGRDALKETDGSVRRRKYRGQLYRDPIRELEAEADEHFSNEKPNAAPGESEVKSQLSPAKAALQDILVQKRQYGEMIDKEFDHRDKIREAKEL